MGAIKHIGLIPDGNRRWAKMMSLAYSDAYKISMNNILAFITHFSNRGIRSVSIYLMSTDNLNRKRDDLTAVIEAETYFIQSLKDMSIEYGLAVHHAGDKSLLPTNMADALSHITEYTNTLDKLHVYLLVAYNPIDEIRNAVQCTSDNFLESLWVPERIDLIIRSAGGPTLLSNFLPLQSGYAQIYMIDKYFNDCTINDYEAIFEKASSINMVYGK